MKNSIFSFYFFYFLDQKHPFFDKCGRKSQTCLFKVKFGSHKSSNMNNSSLVAFTFSVLDGNTVLWSKKSKLLV